MENYFNECLEYQESIKVGLISDYKSDWPEEQPVAPTEAEVTEVMDELEDLDDTDMPDSVDE